MTLENILALYKEGLSRIGRTDLDIISLDFDGNDIHFVEKLLSNGALPKVFVVEYNAKFIPPIRFNIPYDAHHKWDNTDFYGASLTSFNDLFHGFGYKLVCCNAATGVNAFFVRSDFAELFTDVPSDISLIYAPPYIQTYRTFGHKISPKTLEQIVRKE